MLSLIKSFQIDESGFLLELVGGRRLEYRHETGKRPPSLPPLAKCGRVVQSSGEVLEDNVVPLRKKVG